jgi:bifunctional pyridoxal-dependent enzyme with beta-cystathionase and maltose regulon repressor activities
MHLCSFSGRGLFSALKLHRCSLSGRGLVSTPSCQRQRCPLLSGQVIVFEPLYDSYTAMCEQCGGVLVPVQLQPPAWCIPGDALAAAFSERTKLVLVNTPHNPTGKVFTRAELQCIADLAACHGVYVLCDEVYEHLVFEGVEHVSLRALPGAHCAALYCGGTAGGLLYAVLRGAALQEDNEHSACHDGARTRSQCCLGV